MSTARPSLNFMNFQIHSLGFLISLIHYRPSLVGNSLFISFVETLSAKEVDALILIVTVGSFVFGSAVRQQWF